MSSNGEGDDGGPYADGTDGESATALEGWTSSTKLVLTGEGRSAKQKGDRVRVAEGGSDLREELWG